MWSTFMKILKGVARFLYYIFSIYQFSVPVCFLDEADYDLSGTYNKHEMDIEEEVMMEYEPIPLNEYDILSCKLLEMVLTADFESLYSLESKEIKYEKEVLKNYPGWNENVFHVLHYEFFFTSKLEMRTLIDKNNLKKVLSILGISPDADKLVTATEKFTTREDKLLNFIDFLNILYWCDEPNKDGSLGYTAEACRIIGLNYDLACKLDMASLVEYGLF